MAAHLFDLRHMQRAATPRKAFYFYRLNSDDGVSEFCVANSQDPDQYVQTLMPDGKSVFWKKRVEGDLLVFTPPDHRVGSQGLLWAYDRRLQHGSPLPREELEKMALNNRVSVDLGLPA